MTEQEEAELLAEWKENNYGVKLQIYKLEQQYAEAKEILDTWQNKEHPLYERHVSCVDGLETRLKELREQLEG